MCSLLEAAILSVTPTYLATLKVSNESLYKKLSYLKEDIEKPLAAILTFNTIAHTIGAAGAGAEAQKLWGNEYLSIFSAILTFIILFFSEIIPKSIGARNWKSILPISYYILLPMTILSLPIVWISIKISKIIKGDAVLDIGRDEIPAMAELGVTSGTIKESEFRSLKSILDFANLRLRDVLKPADEVVGISRNLHINKALDEINQNTFSRLIVFGLNRDDVKGYVMRKDILQAIIEKRDVKIKDIAHKILILPEKTRAQVMFDRLLAMKAHIAAVIDEEGNFLGIITLEDLIERLVDTAIFDEFDIDS
ncbi:membrane protein, PF01595 family [Bacteriovorax sp. Seq25_V]|nr:membrane protein, PF01595 family [Bacteriovorax sp. Seq25_V]